MAEPETPGSCILCGNPFCTRVFVSLTFSTDCVTECFVAGQSPSEQGRGRRELEILPPIPPRASCYSRSASTIPGILLLDQRSCPPLPHGHQKLVVYFINMSTVLEKESPRARHVTWQIPQKRCPGQDRDTPQISLRQPPFLPMASSASQLRLPCLSLCWTPLLRVLLIPIAGEGPDQSSDLLQWGPALGGA